MMFELRDKKIFVRSGAVYENSGWGKEPTDQLFEELVTIRGLVYSTRAKGSFRQEPYAYISPDRDSGQGLWLDETDYSVVDSDPSPSV